MNTQILAAMIFLSIVSCKPEGSPATKAHSSVNGDNARESLVGVPETSKDLQRITVEAMQQATAAITDLAACPPRENGEPDDSRWEQQFARRVTEVDNILNNGAVDFGNSGRDDIFGHGPISVRRSFLHFSPHMQYLPQTVNSH